MLFSDNHFRLQWGQLLFVCSLELYAKRSITLPQKRFNSNFPFFHRKGCFKFIIKNFQPIYVDLLGFSYNGIPEVRSNLFLNFSLSPIWCDIGIFWWLFRVLGLGSKSKSGQSQKETFELTSIKLIYSGWLFLRSRPKQPENSPRAKSRDSNRSET